MQLNWQPLLTVSPSQVATWQHRTKSCCNKGLRRTFMLIGALYGSDPNAADQEQLPRGNSLMSLGLLRVTIEEKLSR